MAGGGVAGRSAPALVGHFSKPPRCQHYAERHERRKDAARTFSRDRETEKPDIELGVSHDAVLHLNSFGEPVPWQRPFEVDTISKRKATQCSISPHRGLKLCVLSITLPEDGFVEFLPIPVACRAIEV